MNYDIFIAMTCKIVDRQFSQSQAEKLGRDVTMNNETYLTYDVTIRSVSRENAGKCESVTGQMPAYIYNPSDHYGGINLGVLQIWCFYTYFCVLHIKWWIHAIRFFFFSLLYLKNYMCRKANFH